MRPTTPPANGPSKPELSKPSFERETLPWLGAVRQYALRLSGSAADADDLVQITYLNAWKSWHTFKPGSDPRRWLFAICRNAFLRSRQQDARLITLEDADLESLAAATQVTGETGASALQRLELLDLPDAITRAMGTLNPLFREAVLLVDMEGRDYEAAAQEAGVPVGTIRSRLYRGRRLLQEQLLEHAQDLGFRTTEKPA